MALHEDTAHKIGHVYFNLSEGGYTSKKKFTSDDGRVIEVKDMVAFAEHVVNNR
ncbi:hypothetical protein [Paenibacillus glacialis]|uniref:hypothetical protein n=1 Tax=Paenibacillus glacialis TaxID=494026 RepID=UPI000AA2FB18|nr:hypothetical protein [Paenibacillus glacialis]